MSASGSAGQRFDFGGHFLAADFVDSAVHRLDSSSGAGRLHRRISSGMGSDFERQLELGQAIGLHHAQIGTLRLRARGLARAPFSSDFGSMSEISKAIESESAPPMGRCGLCAGGLCGGRCGRAGGRGGRARAGCGGLRRRRGGRAAGAAGRAGGGGAAGLRRQRRGAGAGGAGAARAAARRARPGRGPAAGGAARRGRAGARRTNYFGGRTPAGRPAAARRGAAGAAACAGTPGGA